MSRKNIYSLTDQAVVSGGNFLVAVLLARLLGLYDFGIYGICLVVTLLVVGVQASLLISPLYTFLPKIDDEEEREEYISNMTILVVVVSLLFSVISCVCLYFLPVISEKMVTREYALLASVYIFFRLQQECIRRIFFALQDIVETVKIDVFVFALQIMLIVLIGHYQLLSLKVAFVVLGFTYALGAIYGIFILDPEVSDCDCMFKVFCKHWRFGKWLMGGAVLSAVVRDYVILSVGVTLSPVDVGKMRAAERLGGLVGVVIQLMENVIPVRAAHAYHKFGKPALHAFLKKVYLQIFLLALGIILFFCLSPEKIMVSIFGEQFSGIGVVLIGYVLTNLINIFKVPLDIVLRTVEKTSPIFWGIFLGAILNVTVGTLLVQRLGLVGAVWTLVGSSTAILLWYVFWIVKFNAEGKL